MANENEKTHVGSLSRAWSERIKNIRATTVRWQKTDSGPSPEGPSPVDVANAPPDSELFAGPIQEELTTQQVFAGDEDFYRTLKDTQPGGGWQSLGAGLMPGKATGYKRFSFVQKALAGAIILIVAMLVYVLSRPPAPSVVRLPRLPLESVDQMVPDAGKTGDPEPLTAKSTEPDSTVKPLEAVSLKTAQVLYLSEDYYQAAIAYEKLHDSLTADPKEDLMRDFLQLQIALCKVRIADYAEADRLLKGVGNSSSPAVRVLAGYHSSLLEMHNKRYLDAQTKAYQAIALIDSIDLDKDRAMALKRDCYFLAAEAVTRKVLSLCDADKDLPEALWGSVRPANEAFMGVDETQLRSFLNSGAQRLSLGTLGPQIRRFKQADGLTRYDVTCSGAPVEELLTRFAANAGVDLHWDLTADEIGLCRRPVYLYLPSATTQQFAVVAAGCAGLLTRIEKEDSLKAFNPARYSDAAEQISFLGEEAVSLWRSFLLRFPADKRLENAHFALGLLHSQKGQHTEAIAEYKLLINRFARSALAPHALLQSAKLKTGVRNYVGGRLDLKQLVEQYPDSEITANACRQLADTSAMIGLEDEAMRLYRKVYNFDPSLESQAAAALGVGKCSYRAGDFKSAAKWLTRHITVAADSRGKDFYSACLILGKTYIALEQFDNACNALEAAVEGGQVWFSKEQYAEAISVLVDAYTYDGQFVKALDMLEGVNSATLSGKGVVGILLLKSKVFRAIGLVDKAIALLGNRARYVQNSQLAAEINFELSECYLEKGDLDTALEKLVTILELAESGPLAHQSALNLADICLKLGKDSQAISVCSQLLDLEPPEQIKQEALQLLAAAYNQQKNYDSAALALLGQWK